jgi:hypothetical protein
VAELELVARQPHEAGVLCAFEHRGINPSFGGGLRQNREITGAARGSKQERGAVALLEPVKPASKSVLEARPDRHRLREGLGPGELR